MTRQTDVSAKKKSETERTDMPQRRGAEGKRYITGEQYMAEKSDMPERPDTERICL